MEAHIRVINWVPLGPLQVSASSWHTNSGDLKAHGQPPHKGVVHVQLSVFFTFENLTALN